jgi:hypothetical protein
MKAATAGEEILVPSPAQVAQRLASGAYAAVRTPTVTADTLLPLSDALYAAVSQCSRRTLNRYSVSERSVRQSKADSDKSLRCAASPEIG